MKDLKIHNNEKGDLLSIKSIENTYYDRNYFISIVTTLFSLTKGCFYVEVSRHNYDYNAINLILQLKAILNSNCNFEHTNFGTSFCTNELNESLLETLPVIWFAYEHIAFCFFTENKIEFNVKRKPWYEITKMSKSYVLFKGIEDDVIWIGKNNEMKFDLK